MLKTFCISLMAISFIFVMVFFPGQNTAEGKTNWQLTCDTNKRLCHMISALKNKNARVISVFRLQKVNSRKLNGKITMAMLDIPLGLHIPSGVIIRVDKKVTIKATLVDCLKKGCRAVFNATSKVIDAMQKGSYATVHIVDSKSRKKLILNYSLVGFTKTWSSFQQRS